MTLSKSILVLLSAIPLVAAASVSAPRLSQREGVMRDAHFGIWRRWSDFSATRIPA
jgi:hypothetical protein